MALSGDDPIRDLADRAIRDSLNHPEDLRGLLEQAVPQLAAGFECQQARLLEREFPLDDWRRREADLPFEIPFKAGDQTVPALVVVLIEHQSDTDPLLPLRLLYFAVVYWDKQWREWEKLPRPRPPFRLHPVLPLVVYTGSVPWGSNRALADLMGEPQVFHAFVPKWEPLFWNLADQTPESLLASTNAWVQTLAVLRGESADADRFQDIFTQAVQALQKMAASEHVRWYDLMRILVTWALLRRPHTERDSLMGVVKRHQPSDILQKEIEEMNKQLGPTIADLARTEGKHQGQIETYREVLKDRLIELFGAIPETLVQQIDAVEDLAQLKQAVKRVSTCSGLEQFRL